MLTFLNAAVFVGFLAVAVPPLVHLFSRKRYDEVDWAAMQFLVVSPKTRRKVFLEHFLLMLLRMVVVGLVVAAVAGPVVNSRWLNRWFGTTKAGERDFVILIDGSASMGYRQNGRTAAEAAKRWAAELLDGLRPGDRVAVFQARQSAVPLLGTLSADRDQARNALDLLAPPRGGVDWPACVQAARAVLESARPEREIVILTDGQRYGWADETTLAKWDLIGGGRKPVDGDPRLWYVTVAADRPADPANRFLDAITTVRGVVAAGREVKFKSAVRYTGGGDRKAVGPIHLEVDGRRVAQVPTTGAAADGVQAIEFRHKFSPGSHLVTLVTDPDDLPTDDRQDFAIEVLPSVPVLIVDGDARPDARNRGGEFLRDALAPAKDPTPGFAVKLISLADFTPQSPFADVKAAGTSPRVIVLSNVPVLSKVQNETVEKYLADGGSVLATLGNRADAGGWNRVSFRAGQGWLPARLVDAVGTDAADAKRDDAPKPQPAAFTHPAMEIFKDPLPGGLHTAVFPKRWKLDPTAGVNGATGVAAATLTSGEPLLVERGVGRGRAAVCAVPLDNTWGTNFHTLPDFVRFAHEWHYYLAGAKAAERNLAPGQPIVFSPPPGEPAAGLMVHSPDGSAKPMPAKTWPVVFDATRDPGAYKITTTGGRSYYYAVRSDPQESVLTPLSDDDAKRVSAAVPALKTITRPGDIDARETDGVSAVELWWPVLVLVLGLLLMEVWYTRRLAAAADSGR